MLQTFKTAVISYRLITQICVYNHTPDDVFLYSQTRAYGLYVQYQFQYAMPCNDKIISHRLPEFSMTMQGWSYNYYGKKNNLLSIDYYPRPGPRGENKTKTCQMTFFAHVNF